MKSRSMHTKPQHTHRSNKQPSNATAKAKASGTPPGGFRVSPPELRKQLRESTLSYLSELYFMAIKLADQQYTLKLKQ